MSTGTGNVEMNHNKAIEIIQSRIMDLNNFNVFNQRIWNSNELNVLQMKLNRSLEILGGKLGISIPQEIYSASHLKYEGGYFPVDVPPQSELKSRINRLVLLFETFINSLEEEMPIYTSLEAQRQPEKTIQSSRRVFIVHGHDELEKEKLARFLRDIDMEPIILDRQAGRGATIIEKIEAQNEINFAFVLLTPDDLGNLPNLSPLPRARQNVIFELGYFIGKLGRSKVCILKKGDDLEIPSDVVGIGYITLDKRGAWKIDAMKELREAGFQVDFNKIN